MPLLFDRLAALGAASLDAVWLPVAVWTLAALAAWGLDRALPLRRPRLRAGLLAALVVALPLGLLGRPLLHALAPAPVAVAVPVALDVTVEAAPEAPADAPAPPLGAALLGAFAALAAGGGALRLGALGVAALRLRRALGALPVVERPDVQAAADALAAGLGMRPVPVTVVAADAVPLAAGVLRPRIVVPQGLADDPAALRLVLLHELAHVRHGDPAANAVVQVVAAAFGGHPLVGALVRRIDLHREHACDAAVLAAAPAERRPYGELLVRYALGPSGPFALSAASRLVPTMAVRPSHLQTRLMAMTTSLSLHRGLGATLVGAALTLSAMALPALAQTSPTPPVRADPDAGPMPVPTRPVQAEYPTQAAADVVSGRVVVLATVGIDGTVQNAVVQRVTTDRKGEALPAGNPYEQPFADAALASVRQWRFEPAKENGVPVVRDAAIPVRFKATDPALRAAYTACNTPRPLSTNEAGELVVLTVDASGGSTARTTTEADQTWLACLVPRLDGVDEPIVAPIRAALARLGGR